MGFGSVNRDDLFELRDLFSEDPFHAHFHGHGGTGAALAGSLQPHFDGFIFLGRHEFYVATVALEGRPDRVDRLFYSLLEAIFGIEAAAAAQFTQSKSPK